MKINIITNIEGGKGLQRDYWLLREYFMQRGHEVNGLQFNLLHHSHHAPQADVNLFCETVAACFLDKAPRNLALPNPEWWLPEYQSLVGRLDGILCKTRDAERIFKDTGKARYVGFFAQDIRDQSVRRLPKALHIAGGSRAKNTESVALAWHRFGIPMELVVVSKHFTVNGVANVTTYTHLPAPELHRLQNECLYHVMPSAYEGYGHAIHEGLSTGNILITTDAPPMRDLVTQKCQRVKVASSAKFRAAELYFVEPEAVAESVMACIQMNPTVFRMASGRSRFEKELAEFDANMQEVLAG